MGAQFHFYTLVIIVQNTIGKRLVTFLDMNRTSALLKFTMELNFVTIHIRIDIIKTPLHLLGQVDIYFPIKHEPHIGSPGLI